jgi:hypothetical protein
MCNPVSEAASACRCGCGREKRCIVASYEDVSVVFWLCPECDRAEIVALEEDE